MGVGRTVCPFCQDVALDPLGLHAVTCRHGGDVVIRHNHLHDVFVDFCRRAHLSVSVEKGHGLTSDHSHTRPADVLIAAWDRGKPAAFDVTVTSPLCPAILRESCRSSDAASTTLSGPLPEPSWQRSSCPRDLTLFVGV